MHTPSGSAGASGHRRIRSAGATQRYTLQAVSDWYEAFVWSGISDGPLGREEVPGFPGLTRQRCTFDENGVRVQFFDADGNDAGGLELWWEDQALMIRTPDGPVFRVRQADTIADLKIGRDRHGTKPFEGILKA
jgi:hypothetical protein